MQQFSLLDLSFLLTANFGYIIHNWRSFPFTTPRVTMKCSNKSGPPVSKLEKLVQTTAVNWKHT